MVLARYGTQYCIQYNSTYVAHLTCTILHSVWRGTAGVDEKNLFRKRCVSALDRIAEEDFPAGGENQAIAAVYSFFIHRRIRYEN